MKNSTSFWIIILGIVIPAITFTIELTTGFCAENFLDPIPRWPLSFAVGLVPASIFLYWLRQHDGLKWIPEWLINGLVASTIPISAYYCLIFCIMFPFALIGIIYFGIGLLPLAPLFTLIIGIWVIYRDRSSRSRTHWIGFGAGIIFLLLIEGPSWVTYSQIKRIAEDDSPTTIESAAWICDHFGSEKSAHIHSSTDGFSAAEPVAYLWNQTGFQRRNNSNISKEASLLYYYMTGKSVSQIKLGRRMGIRNSIWRTDVNLGGDNVGARLQDLKLDHSMISAKIETASRLIYQEWTVELKNGAAIPQEGRALVKLPKGSVVSRLTLWVNGEPQEAAFARKEKVTAAYKKVAVVQRKDPVLVRWAGPDRIYVQCFPVPANGGSLKYRIGFISPLDKGQKIVPPQILEHNFNISESFDHTVRYQSSGPLTSDSKDLDVVSHPVEGTVLMGQLQHVQFQGGRGIGTVQVDPTTIRVWTRDDLDSGKRVLVRESKSAAKPGLSVDRDLIFLLDGSETMNPYIKSIAEIVAAMPAKAKKVGVVIADRGEAHEPASYQNDISQLKNQIRHFHYRRGIDNAPAMVRALRLAEVERDTDIIWIHGPQPVDSASDSALKVLNNLSVKPKVRIHSFSVYNGENYLLRKLMESPALRSSQSIEELSTYLENLDTPAVGDAYEWNHLAEGAALPEGATEVSNTLARYWAFQKVMKELHGASWDKDDTEFAAKYQLVTPFTGAVVLETRQQFAENGLTPVDSETTTKAPSVPEPEFYLLLLLAALIALWMNRNHLLKPCLFAR